MDRLHSGLKNLNVMVVEFDRWTRLHVTTALDELDVSVAEASNGVTALRRALAEAPHVVIVGSRLPELAASELLSELRSDPRTRHTAVVGLTNVADGDADLQLPCTPREVLISVASALEARRQTVAAAPIRSMIATPVGARPLVNGGSAWGRVRTRSAGPSANARLSSSSSK